MDCPTCRDPLEEKAQETGLFLDLCPTCGGVWFDAGELAALGARADGFAATMERALKTLTPTPRACCRCGKPLERAWIAELELEIDICSACKGSWLARERFQKLRTYIRRKIDAAAPPPSPVQTHGFSAPAYIVIAAAAVFWLSSRAHSPHGPAGPRGPAREAYAAPNGLKTPFGYEHEALLSEAEGRAAESHSDFEAALDKYYNASGLYFLAIRYSKNPDAIWRLDNRYAELGARVAAIELRQGRPAEAEKVQNVRLAVFERHHDVAGQIQAWQGLAQAAEADGRREDAAERRKRAAALAR